MPDIVTVKIGDITVEYDKDSRAFKMEGANVVFTGTIGDPPTHYPPNSGANSGQEMPSETQVAVGTIDLLVKVLDALAAVPAMPRSDKATITALSNKLSQVALGLRAGDAIGDAKATVALAIKVGMDQLADWAGNLVTSALLGMCGAAATSWSGPGAAVGVALAIGIGQLVENALSNDELANLLADGLFAVSDAIVRYEIENQDSLWNTLTHGTADQVDDMIQRALDAQLPTSAPQLTPKIVDAVKIYDGNIGFNEASFADATGAVTADLRISGVQNGGAAGQIVLRTIEGLVGSNYNDTLIGNFANNQIRGGAGNDFVDGGAGFDYADYADATAGVVIDLRNTVQAAGDRGADTLIGIEGIIGGNWNDTLTGNDVDNVLIGGMGDDVLSGGGGNDMFVVHGADGPANGESDIVDGGDGFDFITFGPTSGVPGQWSIVVDVQVDLAAGTASALGGQVTLTSVEGVIGGAGSDTLLGDGGTNYLLGLDGNDIIDGRAGDDYIDGGRGSDVLSGGDGIDTLSLQSSFGGVTASLNNSTINGDTVSGFENLVGSESDDVLGGSAGANVLTGARGNDYLQGGGGDDILNGGSGNDTLFGGAGNDRLFGDEGADYVAYIDSTDGVTVSLNAGTAHSAGQGNDTLVGIENVHGSRFDDILVGSSGANTLQGGLGRDVIIGLGGDDIIVAGSGQANELYGGAGNDYYIVEANDSIIELAGEGVDSVEARVSAHTLAANIENLFYVGTGNFTGNGNAINNVIVGGAGDDILTGGGGNDRLYGGEGTDFVVLRGLQDDYLIEHIEGGVRITDLVAGRDGQTVLYDIEKMAFSDGSVVDIPALAGRGGASSTEIEYPDFRPQGLEDGDPWWFAASRNLDAELSGC